MRRRTSHRGFTLVEMLVVISIISLLMALLIGGISSVFRTSKTSKQMSDLRQMFTGWSLYANQYNDQCIPGFLSVDVQKKWNVSYRMSGKIEGQSTDKLDRAVAQTYPWRLAPYLDYSWEMMLGYRDDSNSSDPKTLYTIPPLKVQSTYLTTWLASMVPSGLTGSAAALQPAYGYNAYYLGGWWEISNKSNLPPGTPRPYFTDGKRIATNADHDANPMARTLGGITVPDRMTVFCPAAYLQANTPMPGADSRGLPGSDEAMASLGPPPTHGDRPVNREAKAGYRDPDPTAPGAAWITPPWLGEERIWTISNSDISSLALYTDQAMPLMRYSKQIPSAKGDGSTKMENYGVLDDMRAFLNLADITNAQKARRMHTGTIHDQ
ncbi:MAG: type II secretion system GspH family protein [Planctomycetes bacterium]|nr:type II secretion system GspH family protein [Planctomycetota bacterium]